MIEPARNGKRGRKASALMLLALGGSFACASIPPPREQLAQARDKVRSAQTEQAGQYAPLELRKAQDDLDQAERAMREERNIEARRKAELARAEAELALARTQRARNEVAVNELTQTVSALEDEIRNATTQEIRP